MNDNYRVFTVLMVIKNQVAFVGLHSDGRTTKGHTTYDRTTNHRTKSAMVCTTCYYVCGSLILKGDGMTGHFVRCSSQLKIHQPKII